MDKKITPLSSDPKGIKKRMRKERVKRNLTVIELSRLSGVSPVRIEAIELLQMASGGLEIAGKGGFSRSTQMAMVQEARGHIESALAELFPILSTMRTKENPFGLDFGDYVEIEQKRYGCENEMYLHKVINVLESNSWVDIPLGTISSKEHFGLVEPGGKFTLDIRFRMLQPHEEAAAMSFPKDYVFRGTKGDIQKQIGNAVPVRLSGVLAENILRIDVT